MSEKKNSIHKATEIDMKSLLLESLGLVEVFFLEYEKALLGWPCMEQEHGLGESLWKSLKPCFL